MLSILQNMLSILLDWQDWDRNREKEEDGNKWKEKEDGNQFVTDEVLENLPRLLHIRVIRNKDAFLLHQIFRYLKEVAMTMDMNLFFTHADEKFRNY